MKKYFTLTLLCFLFSCAVDEAPRVKRHASTHSSKRSYGIDDGDFSRNKIKTVYRLKPTESMQAGIPKQNTPKYDVAENENFQSDEVDEDVKSSSGVFKVGNPYQIFGVSYFPQNYEDFEEVGMASWYGDDFHGKLTANGETYNMDDMTAAHPTLPLPSLVRVTNLKNGKSVIVRVNDRGPFAKSRILDVSEKAAIELGFKDHGTTEVRIELLRSETDEMLKKLKQAKND